MSDDRFLKNYFLHKKTDFIHKTDVQDFSFNFCFMAGICRYILPYSAIFPIIRVVYWVSIRKRRLTTAQDTITTRQGGCLYGRKYSTIGTGETGSDDKRR